MAPEKTLANIDDVVVVVDVDGFSSSVLITPINPPAFKLFALTKILTSLAVPHTERFLV